MNIDPAYTFSGSFDSINYSYNLQDAGDFNVAYSIAISQNGNLYTGPIDTVTPNGLIWSSFSGATLTQSSFCLVNADASLNCAANPVFTGNIMPTEFGYLVENSFTSGTRNYLSGIDNWSVTLNSAVPEPSSLGLLYCAGGLLGLAFIGRRRKTSK